MALGGGGGWEISSEVAKSVERRRESGMIDNNSSHGRRGYKLQETNSK